MEIRPLQSADRAALGRFLERVPAADRTFFKEDVDDPAVVDGWALPGPGTNADRESPYTKPRTTLI